MNNTNTDFAKGLEGVIATESAICKIDGQRGLLSYRGYPIEELAENYSFEEITYLLLEKALPTAEQARAYSAFLRKHRPITPRVLDFIRLFPMSAHPMKILQATVPLLGIEHRAVGNTVHASGEGAEHLISQFATVIAAIHRIKNNLKVIEPHTELSHGANFIYMLHGTAPSKIAGRVMDACLTLHAEHSLNASTFTARVVSSTLTSCYSSISAAVGALYGPLHGGANEKVLQMVDEIGSIEAAQRWVSDAIANKKKIMGMGHRVYKAKDPRSYVIEKLLAILSDELPHNNDYEILKEIEKIVGKYMEEKGKQIYPNVDFFSGAAYRMLNIPNNLFTPIFALARVSGWMAHIREQVADNRIYRPKAKYIGEDIRSVKSAKR